MLRALPVQILLKNQHCGDPVDVLTPFSPVKAHFFKMLFGGETRQAFVRKDHRNAGGFVQLLGKARNFLALRAGTAIHVKGLPDHNLMDFIFFRDLPQPLDIRFRTCPLNGRASLRGLQQGIADRDSDLLITNVQAHDPHKFVSDNNFTLV